MSNEKKTEAKLKGFEGPYFNDPVIDDKPRGLSRVQKRLGYNPERFHHQFLDTVAKVLPSGKVFVHPETDDGYRWTAAVRFSSDGSQFMVLIPMLLDSKRRDDTFADRHVALYSLDASTEEERDAAALLFATEFVRVYRKKYQASIELAKQQKSQQTLVD